MMINSKWFKEKNILKNKFWDYLEPQKDNEYPVGYKIRDDAPEEEKKAYEEYMEIVKKEHKQRENSPFM